MKKLFTSFSFMRVPKMEFPELVNSVIRIADKYEPMDLFISVMYNNLKNVQFELASLSNVFKKVLDTVGLKSICTKRENMLIAILAQTKALAKGEIGSMIDLLKSVLPFVDEYFGHILDDNTKTRSRRINLMFIALGNDNSLQDAMISVGLMAYFNELRTIQLGFETTQAERITFRAARPKMRTKEVKEVVSDALINFLKAIEIAAIEHPTLSYTPMVNEINDVLNSYKTQLNSNETRNKTAADEAKLPPVLVTPAPAPVAA